ncbi:MAG: hypothetical protein IJK31_09280 [Ruminococcus sp.]|nr:hypothetical protein [Ruminococcus sp.]
MKLERFAALMSAVILTAGISSCGNKDNEGKKSSGGSKLDGEYCTIVPVNGKRMFAMDKSLDEYLDYSKDCYDSLAVKELGFDGGNFEMTDVRSAARGADTIVYNGSYDVSDGKILFKYDQTTRFEKNGEKTVFDIADGKPDYDSDIITEKKQADKEEVTAEMQKMTNAKMIERMEKFNETGTFYNSVGNSVDFSDKIKDFNIMPLFVHNVTGNNKQEDVPVYLYHVDDLLCVPTYGFKLDGKYKYGKDFTIDYNALDVYLDDEYSMYYRAGYDKDKSKADSLKSVLEKQLGSTDDTKLEFSDGRWEWYSSDGELINDGVYEESSEYKGLIAMSITDDSLNCDADFKVLSPIFFYIDGSGSIWLPYMMKVD